jgi:hypothetical protein
MDSRSAFRPLSRDKPEVGRHGRQAAESSCLCSLSQIRGCGTERDKAGHVPRAEVWLNGDYPSSVLVPRERRKRGFDENSGSGNGKRENPTPTCCPERDAEFRDARRSGRDGFPRSSRRRAWCPSAPTAVRSGRRGLGSWGPERRESEPPAALWSPLLKGVARLPC